MPKKLSQKIHKKKEKKCTLMVQEPQEDKIIRIFILIILCSSCIILRIIRIPSLRLILFQNIN